MRTYQDLYRYLAVWTDPILSAKFSAQPRAATVAFAELGHFRRSGEFRTAATLRDPRASEGRTQGHFELSGTPLVEGSFWVVVGARKRGSSINPSAIR